MTWFFPLSCLSFYLRALRVPSTNQLNTLSNNPLNPLQEGCSEIEVTDPTHPLFGRRFLLLSMSVPSSQSDSSSQRITYAFVLYREYMVLRIPLFSTNLAHAQPFLPTKFTLQSLYEIISIAKDCEELCPIDQNPSGQLYPPNSKDKSVKKSHPSCRR
jgi:hypothetical protein